MSGSSLWSDDPARVDLLSFDAVAQTVADALMDPNLDPVALALSGAWGSGKTTVLGLVKQELVDRSKATKKVLVIETDPWRYDPVLGAKETLIGEVLSALADEIEKSSPAGAKAKSKAAELVAGLARRVDWAKALKLAAKTSLALQIPSLDDIVRLVQPASPEGEAEEEPRNLETFRREFSELIESEALKHIQVVAVLVDDLDRCLPETVIETLEAIRLFLAVPRMSFVLAADEDRVAEAIATRFGAQQPGQERPVVADGETPAQLYLHKIVQTTIPIPSLSRFDTQAFLLLLQLQQRLTDTQLETLTEGCSAIRRAGGSLDSLELDGVDLNDELAFASRLTPILYEKHRGNPRRLKRFLNDLSVRQAIAARRGIALDAAVVAKLMVLERLLLDEFTRVLDWLGSGTLRDRLAALETAAGKPPQSNGDDDDPPAGEDAGDDESFSEPLVRWAKLLPPLAGIDLSPYLYLAAAFTGKSLLDESLPERLRDIAANLLSSSRVDQRAVEADDIDALSPKEAVALLEYLGRAIRDQPALQKSGVTGILRIVRVHQDQATTAKQALLMLPPDDITIAMPLLVKPDDPPPVFEALDELKEGAKPEAKAAIEKAINERAS